MRWFEFERENKESQNTYRALKRQVGVLGIK